MDINNLWSGYDLNSKKQNTRCLAVNTILEGKYLVGPVLGQGGFGITYVGYDLNMEAKIAIKEYFPVELVSRDTTTMHGDRVLSLSGEKSVTYKTGLKKYVAEAQNVSQFSEIPGVVSVKDFFYANDTAYIVMEYIDGISLKDYIKEKGGSLTEEETLRIMRPVLEALVQVHNSGIIHRDISPDNIMLTFEGSGHSKIKSVKLIDFGAARMTAKNDQKSLTIILKHGYAPEEQYRTHGEQGPWTDVYALCAVLYRMLTGETPVPAMDRMFQDELKTFDKFNTKVSANTAAAILKGLAVKKDERIQNVQELIGALYEGAKVKTAAGTGKSGKNKVGLFAGIGVAALAAVIGISVLGKSGKTEVPVATAVQEASGISGNVNAGGKGGSQSAAETASQTEAVMDLTVEEEILGEQIVFYNPQRSISSPLYGHILFGMPDGTVKAIGNNSDGACDVEDWDHVAAVSTGDGCSFGIRTDGTVLFTKDMFAPEFGWDEVEYWTDILDIRCGLEYVLGLKKDGTILVSGNTEEAEELRTELAEWKNIKAIECVRRSVYGLTEDGEVLFAGRGKPEAEITITDWDSANYIIQPHDPTNYLCGIFDDGSVKRMNLSTGEIREEEGFYRYYDGLLGVREDGTIAYNDLAQFCFDVQDETIVAEINSWTDMQAAVFNQYNTAVGFKTDGTPMILSGNQGNVQLADMKNLKWIQAVPGSDSANLLACTNDGKILTYGPRMSEAGDAGIYAEGDNVKWYNEAALLLQDGTLKILRHEDGVQTFHGVKQVYEISNGWYNDYQYFCYYIFLLEDGTVQLYKSGSFESIEEQIDPILKGLETWTDIVQIESVAGHATVGLKEDGSVFMCCEEGPNVELSSGEEKVTKLCSNTMGTLIGVTENGHVKWFINTNDSENSGMLQFENWENIVDAAMGEYHTVGLRADGTVAATGNNSWGQCDVEEWTDIVSIIADRSYTIGINKAGDMLIAGLLY